ncbi:MAG: YdcF family protein [Defluviitaleaceae bacterium]|nr:YdcF family protein [Defluviitaleaceae bacterium]
MKYILLAIGILSLMNAHMVLRVSNFSIGFALQIGISLAVIAYALLYKRIYQKFHIMMGLACLLPALLVVFLFVYGKSSNVDYTEDVVIVLGAAVVGETVTRPLARRLDAALHYWQNNPDAYIIVCGGLGNRAVITEAEAMARYLARRGVPRERILLEEYSTSTYENLAFAKEILDEHFPDGFSAVLVTNDFHIYRGVRTARRIGIDVNRLGAYTDWYSWPVNYLREMLAVAHMWVFA